MLCAVALLSALEARAAEVAGSIRVIDGDTFDVGKTRIRLYGVDAPEKDQTCATQDGRVWPCGAWVTSQVSQRFEGQQARCHPIDLDRYGRTVARCYVQGLDVGRRLVQDGLAFAYRKYAMDYDLDEKAAFVRGAGIHSSEIQAPAAFRADSRAANVPEGNSGCVIKGNISSKGVRIYHRPGQHDYDATRISPAKGERWFCSAAEAEAAGWRPARR